MICPLMSRTKLVKLDIAPSVHWNDDVFVKCQRENCAWWNIDYKDCCIKIITPGITETIPQSEKIREELNGIRVELVKIQESA